MITSKSVETCALQHNIVCIHTVTVAGTSAKIVLVQLALTETGIPYLKLTLPLQQMLVLSLCSREICIYAYNF